MFAWKQWTWRILSLSSDLTLENLSALIPKKLSYFLDAIFTKSRTFTAQEKKNLRKVAMAHVILQWCYRFVCSSNHKTTCFGWCSVCIGTFVIIILDFEKYASVSTIEFTDTLLEEESMKCFLQFITNNFDHNEDTTTGVCTTHVMGLISSKYPKSDILSTQPIMKQTIIS